jgi:hypothetical protein
MSQTPPPHPALANSRFLAFFDECGDHSLTKIDPDFPLFVLALVVVERKAYRDVILPELTGFKLRYWNHEGINLHSREIRLAAGPFNMLLNPRVRPTFMQDLTRMVERLPFTLFTRVKASAAGNSFPENQNRHPPSILRRCLPTEHSQSRTNHRPNRCDLQPQLDRICAVAESRARQNSPFSLLAWCKRGTCIRSSELRLELSRR